MALKIAIGLSAAAFLALGALALALPGDGGPGGGLTLSSADDGSLAFDIELASARRPNVDTPTTGVRDARPSAPATTAEEEAPATAVPEPTVAVTPVAQPTLTPTPVVAEGSEAKKGQDSEDQIQDVEDLNPTPTAGEPAPTATPDPEPTPGSTNWASNEQQMLDKHNEARAAEGRSALAADPDLKAMAEYRCLEMADGFSHAGFQPALAKFGISYFAAGENLASIPSVGGAFNAWMNSPGHRSNILNGSFDRVGIAYCEIGGQSYWVADFIG